MKMEKSVLRQLTLWEIIMDVIIPEVSRYEVKNTDDVILAEFGPREYREAHAFIQGTTNIIHHVFEDSKTD